MRMDDVSRYFERVEFPATKDELIDAAVGAEAPQAVVERLQQLGSEQYDNPGELERELAEDD